MARIVKPSRDRPIPQLQTPPRRSRSHASPSSSPANSDHHSSDEETLEGSFLLVGDDDNETASTIGSSIPDSILDVLSDTNSDTATSRDMWDESTDEDDNAEPRDATSSTAQFSAVSTSLNGGSYIDAEGTLTDLGDSRSTLHRDIDSVSSSQVKFIMPDPSNSFTTSSGTMSAAVTPLGSIANLPPASDHFTRQQLLRRSSSKRGVDQSWLEASSKLWNVAPDVQASFSEEILSVTEEAPYHLLASEDSLKTSTKEDSPARSTNTPLESVVAQTLKTPEIRALAPHRASIKASILARLRSIDGLGRIISNPLSWMAFASVLSLAVIQSIYPTAFSTMPGKSALTAATNTLSDRASSLLSNTARTSTFWERLSVTPSPVTSTHALASSSAAPLATQRVPDLQLIRDALSGFSIKTSKPASSEQIATDDDGRPQKRRRIVPVTHECKMKDVKDHNTPVTDLTIQHGNAFSRGLSIIDHSLKHSWQRKALRRLHNASASFDTPNPSNLSSSMLYRRSAHIGHFIMDYNPFQRYMSSLRLYTSNLGHALGGIYGPTVAELHKEYQELLALLHAMAETSSTMTEFIIRRAARGLKVSRVALEAGSQRLRDHMPPLPHAPSMDSESLGQVKAQLDILSEYVETQATHIADYFEEQSRMAHERGMDSLKQAKLGLDNVIAEARKLVDGSPHPDGVGSKLTKQAAPMPRFNGMSRSEAKRRIKESAAKERSQKSTEELHSPRPRRSHPPAEKPSKAKRFMDMVHHGALTLVQW